MKKTVRMTGYSALLALALAAPASALTINQGLQPGFNTIEDQDREAFVDVNNNGLIDIGDVFVGFVRLDDFIPSTGQGSSTNNQVYGVFTNQIIGTFGDTTQIILGTTTVVGLRLEDITGDANTAGGMFAIYDRDSPYGNNVVTQSAPGATSIEDDNNYIVDNGVLRIVAGIGSADSYFWVDTFTIGLGSPTSALTTVPTSVTIGSFVAGLDVMYNNTIWTYNDAVITQDFLGGIHVTQIGVGNGAIRGSVGDSQAPVFTTIGYDGFTQCRSSPTSQDSVRCGTVTDADFFVNVSQQEVPEPGSLALLGAALLAVVGLRRRSKQA